MPGADGDPQDGQETIEEQQDRQAAEGLEHPAPSAVEADEDDQPDADPMEGPAPTG